MQDVNNDMDDLFKQAGEKYPLKTDGADWDQVLAGLKDADAPVAATVTAKSNRKKRALWLLLLLPLSSLLFVLHNHFQTINNSSTNIKISTQNKTTANQQSAANNPNQQANVLLKNENNSKIKSNRQVQKSDPKRIEIIGTEMKASLQNRSILKPQSTHHLFMNENERAANNSTYKDGKQNNESVLINNKNKVEEKQPDDVLARIHNAKAKQNKNDTAEQKTLHAIDELSKNKKDSSEAKTTQAKDEKKVTAKAKTQQQQGFYAGLLGSLDVSTVKLQRINKAGYSVNVLAGYRISKRLSVESGISLSKKNYYSTGKYFDKKKAGIPDQVKIYFSNSSCNMLEIPVNLKYDFALHKKSNLFVVAGLSSYIMKKENYGYHGNYNNMWIYDTVRCYKNSGANLLSVVNISIGYQLHLNKATTLRIEPYLKVPLKGIGIANMPIMSTGISVGFTRSF